MINDAIKLYISSLFTQVIIANKLDCPIMSNDSDFYMFDVRRGFIFMTDIEYDADKPFAADYINVPIYFRRHLFGTFPGLTQDSLSFAAICLGNGKRPSVTGDDDVLNAIWSMRCPRYAHLTGTAKIKLFHRLRDKTAEHALKYLVSKMTIADQKKRHNRYEELKSAMEATAACYELKNAHGCLLAHLGTHTKQNCSVHVRLMSS